MRSAETGCPIEVYSHNARIVKHRLLIQRDPSPTHRRGLASQIQSKTKAPPHNRSAGLSSSAILHRPSASAAARMALSAEANTATWAEKRVSFKNAKGEQIIGISVDTGSEDVAILCHGLGDHKDGFVLPQMAAALAEKGHSSLRFDFPGNGESDGTFRYANMKEEKEDIRAAVLYLRAQGRSVTGLVGHSKAGTGVILYAADYDDIARVVNVAGRYDNMRGITERFGDDIFDYLDKHGQMEVSWPSSVPGSGGKKTWILTQEDIKNRRELFMEPYAKAIRNSHVLTIHGKADETIPFEDALSYHKQLAKSELVLVDGAGHNFNKSTHADVLIQHTVEFLTSGKVLGKLHK
ncbi:hypothetical protein CVIRNUC_009373 [Coccomyxa viridis]|uniref:AB hydrolase-1 domain-containing protein n=1 Tax=Coccomyxa viridis TaxID=1274662 RepID=A0AAV1II91_9CHLO|nr:hypothetical protein CVIRNUC_009373 [Coccomyxa viridis]